MDITAFIDTFGNLGVMGLIGWLVWRGELIPKRSHDEIRSLLQSESTFLKEEIITRLGDKKDGS